MIKKSAYLFVLQNTYMGDGDNSITIKQLLNLIQYNNIAIKSTCLYKLSLLEKEKLVRKISDGKNEIPHKFLDRKI